MSGGPSNWATVESDGKPTLANSNSTRYQDDAEAIKARHVDQSFEMKKYPDPLMERPGNGVAFFPAGVTQEDEKRWLANIEAAKRI